MKETGRYSFIITFVWFGFLAAISFVEAPVKFTAPTLDFVTGLDVGRQVFGALNKAELIFAILLMLSFLITRPGRAVWWIFLPILIILTLQTFWWLPALDARVQIFLDGGEPEKSPLHLVYIIAEVIKLLSLMAMGLLQVRDMRKHFQKPESRA
jgi:hypothetical protein